MRLRARLSPLVLGIALVGVPCFANAASYSETVNGDMSDDRLAPSSVALDFGSNTISGSTVAGDIDYLTVHVPDGGVFAALVLTAFASADDPAFMPIQGGTQFAEPASGSDVANLLGWAHPGLPLGDDSLAIIGKAAGAIGYGEPLPAVDYTVRIQQTGPHPVDYAFDAKVTLPVLGSLALLAFALAVLGAPRGRASR